MTIGKSFVPALTATAVLTSVLALAALAQQPKKPAKPKPPEVSFSVRQLHVDNNEGCAGMRLSQWQSRGLWLRLDSC